jgi:subtilisin family serine protease
VDELEHGTPVLANLLACAPDANVFAIKPHLDRETAIDLARTFPIKVISASWGFDLYDETVFPGGTGGLLTLKSRILKAIRDGITFVAAAGNGGMDFPAIHPRVLAVSGVAVAANDGRGIWSGASSFRHPTIYPTRNVPDVCGVASPILLPYPPCEAGPAGCWDIGGGTSFATPQIAGICALLLQKNPALTPAQIRDVLYNNSGDVIGGSTVDRPPKMPKKTAIGGKDDATGGGLVDALKAWLVV